MTNERLATRLIELESFQKQYRTLVVDSVIQQFSLSSAYQFCPKIDWNYLLKCASILATSQQGRCEDAALRIAQHCLVSFTARSYFSNPENIPNTRMRDAACMILDTLTNKPAIKLAEKQGLVQANFEDRLPLPLSLDYINGTLSNSLPSKQPDDIYVNRFQIDLWERIQQTRWLSVSAPTSTGKSFLLCNWMSEAVAEGKPQLIVYLVPTRALIQQVADDLKKHFAKKGIKANISSFPHVDKLDQSQNNIFVFTQERLYLFINSGKYEQLIDTVIVDEAHKVEDDARGLLLEQAIDKLVVANSNIKFIFACPFINNPEILLQQSPSAIHADAFKSEHVTVNQNLIWIRQTPRKPLYWEMELIIDKKDSIPLGQIKLAARFDRESKKLPLIAHALCKSGCLIYSNSPSQTETMARYLYELSGEGSETDDAEMLSLIDLVKKTIHQDYELCVTLARGVAFHYGNMPLLVRSEIERLFRASKIRYLVCTSTLIEGVNLPCKSIFICKPQRGNGKPMKEFDFWNLAGRAGRLGHEFQGNIICVEPHRWASEPPREKRGFAIQTASEKYLRNPDEFIDYCTRMHEKKPQYNQGYEQLFSYMLSEYRNKGIDDSRIWKFIPDNFIDKIQQFVCAANESLKTPFEIVQRNPGINPLGMDSLLSFFDGYSTQKGKSIEMLVPTLPESDDAVEVYRRILSSINTYMSPIFGNHSEVHKRIHVLSIIVVNWMNGHPLARLIQSRIKYEKTKGKQNIAGAIRQTMDDVEQYARFLVPKYMSCYVDLLKHHLEKHGDFLASSEISAVKLNMWLEYGVSSNTHLALMAIGLSRTSAIFLSEYIANTEMSEKEAKQWLEKKIHPGMDIPIAIQREICEALGKTYVSTKNTD